jgi:hypothetical protein
MKPFFRIINDNYSRKEFSTKNKIYNLFCKDGQRKLLYTEIEFLSLLSRKHEFKNILAVYIGSADGTHLPIIFDMFPEVEWILVDPRKFNFTDRKNVHLMNIYYDDNTYKKIQKINVNNKKIAFISDIRREVEEELIYEDMMWQMKWCIQLDSIAYMFKFRLPYHSDFKSEIKYLFGDIYPQVYASPWSSETRLIYIRNDGEKFKYKVYNIKEYDDHMFYFNSKDRRDNYIFHHSDRIKLDLPGYRDVYENVCEYYFIYIYLKFYKKIKNPEYNDILNLLIKINILYNKLTHKNYLLCYINSYKNLISEFKDIILDTELDAVRINNLDNLKIQFKSYINLLKTQFKKVLKSSKLYNLIKSIKPYQLEI